MSRDVLWQVLGRAHADLTFADDLRANPDRALAQAGYSLEPDEFQDIKHFLLSTSAVPPPGAGATFVPGGPSLHPEDIEFQREKMRHRITVQMKRMEDLSAYSLNLVTGTFDSAKSTYKTITWMNRIMFAVGIGLFLFAALYTVYSEQKVYSLVLGGLGVASFVTLFMLGPIDKAQRALSNVVQAEIAFMNYFDQLTFWENYAQMPRPMPPGAPDPANIERASAALQERSRETIELLQRYVEGPVVERERRGSRFRRGAGPAAPSIPDTAPPAPPAVPPA